MKLRTRVRLAAVSGLAAAAALAVSAPLASAGVTPMTIDPTSGPTGTVITVSSTGSCPLNATVTISLIPGYDGSTDPGGAAAIATGSAPGSQNGSWSGTVTVPPTASPGAHTVTAFCAYGQTLNQRGLRAQTQGFYYPVAQFTVTQQVTTTTVAPTTTVAATTTTVATAPQAITATPTYTG